MSSHATALPPPASLQCGPLPPRMLHPGLVSHMESSPPSPMTTARGSSMTSGMSPSKLPMSPVTTTMGTAPPQPLFAFQSFSPSSPQNQQQQRSNSPAIGHPQQQIQTPYPQAQQFPQPPLQLQRVTSGCRPSQAGDVSSQSGLEQPTNQEQVQQRPLSQMQQQGASTHNHPQSHQPQMPQPHNQTPHQGLPPQVSKSGSFRAVSPGRPVPQHQSSGSFAPGISPTSAGKSEEMSSSSNGNASAGNLSSSSAPGVQQRPPVPVPVEIECSKVSQLPAERVMQLMPFPASPTKPPLAPGELEVAQHRRCATAPPSARQASNRSLLSKSPISSGSEVVSGAESLVQPVGSFVLLDNEPQKKGGPLEDLQAQVNSMQKQFTRALEMLTERFDVKLDQVADIFTKVQDRSEQRPASEGIYQSNDPASPDVEGVPAAAVPVPDTSPPREQAMCTQEDGLSQELLENLRQKLRVELTESLGGLLWDELSGALGKLGAECAELRRRQDRINEDLESFKSNKITRSEFGTLLSQQDQHRQETDRCLNRLLADVENLRRSELHGSAADASSVDTRSGSATAAPGRRQREDEVGTDETSTVDEAGSMSRRSFLSARVGGSKSPKKGWLLRPKAASSGDSNYMLDGDTPALCTSEAPRAALGACAEAPRSLKAFKPLSLPPNRGDVSDVAETRISATVHTERSSANNDIKALREQWHAQLGVLDKHIHDIESMKGSKTAR